MKKLQEMQLYELQELPLMQLSRLLEQNLQLKKPNQPTHNIQAPIIESTGLCGGLMTLVRNGILFPNTIAITNAATPAVV